MLFEEQNTEHWQGIRKGDKESLFALYNDSYFHLARFGLKITPDDELVKDCITKLFFQLWEKRNKLSDVTNVRAYLFTALKRMLIDELRYYSKIDTAVTNLAASEQETEISYEEIIIGVQQNEELKYKLQLALQQLTPRQTELIRLKFFEGMSYEQIALQTQQTIKTAYNTIYDAIKVLRKTLK